MHLKRACEVVCEDIRLMDVCVRCLSMKEGVCVKLYGNM